MRRMNSAAPTVVALCTAMAVVAITFAAVGAQQPPAAPAGRQGGAAPAPSPPACGGRSSNPRVACPGDVQAMIAALPDKAPARPQRPRRILVLAATRGWVHSS